MPLKRFSEHEDSYLSREFIRVNTTDRENATNDNPFEYNVALKKPIQNVVSLEVVGYDIATGLAPTFFSNRQSTRPGVTDEGTRRFNIRVFHSNNTDFVDLEIDLQDSIPFYDYTDRVVIQVGSSRRSTTTQNGPIADTIERALVDQGNIFVNDTNTDVYVATTLTKQLDIMFVRAGPTPVRSIISFPATANCANVLGFDDDTLSYESSSSTDYPSVGTGTNQVIRSPLAMNNQISRFVDVHVAEVPELRPVKRIFVDRAASRLDYVALYEVAHMYSRQRILTDSVRKLDSLTIKFTTGDEERAVPLYACPFNSLVFEVITLNPVRKCTLPPWVKQAFTI